MFVFCDVSGCFINHPDRLIQTSLGMGLSAIFKARKRIVVGSHITHMLVAKDDSLSVKLAGLLTCIDGVTFVVLRPPKAKFFEYNNMYGIVYPCMQALYIVGTPLY